MKSQLKKLLSKTLNSAWKHYSKNFNEHKLRNSLIFERFGYPLNIPVNVDDKRIAKELSVFTHHRHEEYLYDYKELCYIEPTYGYIITEQLFWVERSFAYYHMVDSTPFQSLLKIVLEKVSASNKIKQIDQAVSFRDMNEGNYWHFYDDILSKILLIDRLDIPLDIPIVIGKRLWEQSFFQSAIQQKGLSKRNWLVQTELIKVNRLIFCAKMSLNRENFEMSLEYLKPLPQVLHSNDQRIFLNRSQSRGRFIENFEEVVGILHKFNFKIVDADNLTLQQQINLFSEVRYVIGLHGAGLVNQIHRRGNGLQLLEIFPPDFIHPHYFWLCHAFEYGYDAILGEPGSKNHSFVINPDIFHKKLVDMIAYKISEDFSKELL